MLRDHVTAPGGSTRLTATPSTPRAGLRVTFFFGAAPILALVPYLLQITSRHSLEPSQ